ncbi:aminopeptidase N [Candidatus Pacearchaeota archaeon]|nr:aminopeptidase N [Candidatus Pacearchaeota archaeon]
MPGKTDVLLKTFAESRKEQVDNVKYELFLNFEPKKDKYSGKCRISFFLKDKKQGVVLESISDVKSVLVNGKEAGYEKGDFTIKFGEGLENEKENLIEIEYRADYNHTGDGLHKFTDVEDGGEYIYSNFEPYDAHRMFPCFDQPDIKATLKLSVEIPKKWTAISNEKGEEKTSGENKIVVFSKTKKISTYLFHISAGNYECFEDSCDGIKMKIYFRKSMKKYVREKEMFELTKKGLKFYSDFFDCKYPFSKYDQIFVPEFNSGAMENPGAVTFSEHLLVRHAPTRNDKARIAVTLLHEMAHMWFGDLVTMKWWDDLWLNESFADFMGYFSMFKATEFKDSWEDFYARKAWAYYQDQLPTTHPIAANAEDTDAAFSNFDGISYAKGASVIKQLMFYIGEENFRNGMRNYFKKYAWKNTELADFLECLEEACGKNLSEWFDDWIKTTGINSISSEIEFSDGKIKNFAIIQHPSMENDLLRKHKTKIALFSENNSEAKPEFVKEVFYEGKKTEIKDIEMNGKNFKFAFLNYGDWDYTKDKFDADSLKYILDNLGKIKDLLTRQMIYGCLWQMVRDAEFNPKDFLELVLKNASEEKNLLSLERMFLRVKNILNFFINENDFKIYCDKFFEISFKMLESKIDSERKSEWFNMLAFASIGIGEEKFEKMIHILENKIVFDDFEFDDDKRWSVIARFHARGHEKADELLEIERSRDKSDRGQKNAAVAEASNIKNKKRFWGIYVSGEGKSLDYIREAMKGFYWRIQKEGLEEYMDLFFSDVKTVFEKRDRHYAMAFFENLFPMLYANGKTLKKAIHFLENSGDSNKLLKKYLEEHIDGLKRIIRVLEKYGKD